MHCAACAHSNYTEAILHRLVSPRLAALRIHTQLIVLFNIQRAYLMMIYSRWVSLYTVKHYYSVMLMQRCIKTTIARNCCCSWSMQWRAESEKRAREKELNQPLHLSYLQFRLAAALMLHAVDCLTCAAAATTLLCNCVATLIFMSRRVAYNKIIKVNVECIMHDKTLLRRVEDDGNIILLFSSFSSASSPRQLPFANDAQQQQQHSQIDVIIVQSALLALHRLSVQ